METEEVRAEIEALKREVASLRRELEQMKAVGYVSQRDLQRLVPAILQDYQMRNG